jgi:hypothetical protein
MMIAEMSMDEAMAVVRRAMVVDVCMNERGGERSPTGARLREQPR